jgi:hypothetical protein
VGRLTLLVPLRVAGKTWWATRCDCGTEKDVRVDHLRTGKTRSCGCLARALSAAGNRARATRAVQAGERYGRLVVMALVESAGSEGRSGCVARCDCGVEKAYEVRALLRGRARSCGCLRAEVAGARLTTHGRGSAAAGRRDPTYGVWARMISRCECTDVTTDTYADYAGRGIRVCARWRGSFEAFAIDMGDRPPGTSIDRKENDGGYWCGHCPECVTSARPANCRWATPKEQANNRRSNRRITIDGVTRTLVEWCERTGVPQKNASGRIAIGWAPAEAVTRPVATQQRSTP